MLRVPTVLIASPLPLADRILRIRGWSKRKYPKALLHTEGRRRSGGIIYDHHLIHSGMAVLDSPRAISLCYS